MSLCYGDGMTDRSESRSRAILEASVLAVIWTLFLLAFAAERKPFGVDVHGAVYASYYLLLGVCVGYGAWPVWGRARRYGAFGLATLGLYGLFAVVEEYGLDPMVFGRTEAGLDSLHNVLDYVWYAAAVSLPVVFMRVLLDHRETLPTPEPEAIALIRQGAGVRRTPVADIVLLRADRDYTVFQTPSETIHASGTLAHCLRSLPRERIMRVHKSYAVNLAHVRAFTAARLTTDCGEVPVGRTYRAAVAQRMAALR